ncbi:MAG TPA: hypothetical protein VFB36_09775 [Nevskiaceae bacterium]|nr:hypothetical protein [Nevskiaceae bacterium]
MSISNVSRWSIGLVAALAPVFAALGDQAPMVIYARPAVIPAQHLAVELRDTGRTSCYLGFVPGRAKLDLASYEQVRELAAMLRDDPELKVTVTIRSIANPNATLARERASVLVATLRDLDVLPKRVIAAPMTDPVAVAFNDLARSALLLD